MKVDAISSASSGHTPSHRQPFAAGSLLQQRAEAERQEIENMKLQLRLREQAGVLGAKNFNSVDPPAGYYLHRPNGGLTGITGSNSSNSFSSMSSSSLLSQQQPLKFGGPGTLIEKGEARAAQLQERSKSAGTGLLHPAAHIGNNAYNRSRSKSRGPGEDRSGHYSGSSSPRSTGSASTAASPNGPLLHFEDENAMIKPGLLLDRAKSAKQAPGMGGPGGYSRGYSSSTQAGSRGRQESSNSNNTHSSSNGRTRIKPLIDLGNTHADQDFIGPGLLTAHSSRPAQNGAQSARSPRRNKPLLEF